MINEEIVKAADSSSSDKSSSKNSDFDLFSSVWNRTDDKTVVLDAVTVSAAPVDEPNAEIANEMVVHFPSLLTPNYIQKLRLETELSELYRGGSASNKYEWLSNLFIPYTFGGRTYNP